MDIKLEKLPVIWCVYYFVLMVSFLTKCQLWYHDKNECGETMSDQRKFPLLCQANDISESKSLILMINNSLLWTKQPRAKPQKLGNFGSSCRFLWTSVSVFKKQLDPTLKWIISCDAACIKELINWMDVRCPLWQSPRTKYRTERILYHW